MSFFTKANGILGINARNLLYISKYNSHANKKFADDKVFTKNFLESRGIGVAKLYHVINNHQQLSSQFFDDLPHSFVVKPNRGYAGGGILVIIEKKGDFWITASGKKLNEESLYRQCIDILDGKYSISGTYDQVVIEERLEPHSDFRKLTEVGLPDVRVIVFNLVPVLAMARIPTPESDGKANMELGAVAMGIDIGTGKTTGGAQYSRHISRMPNGIPTKGFQIPFWEEILQAAAKIQHVSKIGFLGCDMVVTKQGVRVLEVNARPGLKIQVANRVPLRARLNKVADLKVLNPEDGVDLAKTLFSQKVQIEEVILQKPVIGMIEPVILNADPPRNLVAKIDLNVENNIISEKYFSDSEKFLDITIADKRLKLPTKKGKIKDADIILAGKYLSDFYVDPSRTEIKNPNLISSDVEERMIRNIDEKICLLDNQIKLLAYINPRNLNEQKSIFLNHPDFSPRFFYRDCPLDFQQMRRDLKKIPKGVDHPLFPLYEKKIRDIEQKLALLEAIDTTEFTEHSKSIFGVLSEQNYRLAVSFIKKQINQTQPDESYEMDTKEATDMLKNFLKEYNLAYWKIKIIEDTVADIQVTKKNTILLKKNAMFRENRLKALLVHEIGTHVFRYENGKLQKYQIFERGTAGYLRTEEGLAVWNQNQLGLSLGDKFLTGAFLVIAVYMAQKMGFRDLFHYLKNTYEIDDELAWKLCVKTKRGFKNTDMLGGFTKDIVYFMGNRDVEKFLQKGGQLEELYIGKISVDDLKYLKKYPDLVPPKFVL